MMEDREIVVCGVSCYFADCQATESGGRFHQSTIALLKRLGVVFYKTAPYPSPVDQNPEQKLEPDGELIKIILASHPLLEPTNSSWKDGRDFRASYGTTGGLSGWFKMGSQPLRDDFPDFSAALQDMANGRREFLKLVIPHVKPRLAYADDTWGGGDVKDRQVEAADLRKLFWVTYFSPHYVAHHGMEFLMNIPAWRVEELDGGVLVTVTEKFLDFAVNEPKETLKYLKQKFKNIRPNRFKIHPAF